MGVPEPHDAREAARLQKRHAANLYTCTPKSRHRGSVLAYAPAHGGQPKDHGGRGIVSVKSLLGHRNIETTMRYSHLSPNHLQQAVNRGSLGDHLMSISQTTSPTPPMPSLDGKTSHHDFQIGTGSKTGSRTEGQRGEGMQPNDYMVRPVGIEPTTLSLEG